MLYLYKFYFDYSFCIVFYAGLNERVIPVVLTPSNAKDKEDEHLKTKVVAGHSNNGSGDVEGSKPKAG